MIFLSFLKIIIIKLLLAFYSLIPQQNLALGLNDNVNTLLPNEISTDSEKIISNLIFRKLFKYEEGILKPDLVKEWSLSEDKEVYTIEIYNNLYWQDGEKITTDDIIYSFTLNKGLIDEVEIDKLSDTKFSVKLFSPNAILPSLLTFGIQPAHLENQSKLQPIGSTSFYVANAQLENNVLNTITLQSFQKDKVYNRIIFKIYPKEEDLKIAYDLGEINAFISRTQIAQNGLTTIPIHYFGRYYSLIFNTEKQKFIDVNNRVALAKTLNTNNLFTRNYFANNLLAEGPISHSVYTKESLKNPLFDTNSELTLLQQNDLRELEILLPNNQDGQQIESFLRSEWQDKQNIQIKPQYIDIEELLDKAHAGEFDILFIGHEVAPDPDRYSFWHSTQKGFLNLSKFEDLRADKALEEGRKTAVLEERTQHYNIFQDVMETKVPAIFLYHPGFYLNIKDNKSFSIPNIVYTPADLLANL